MEKVINEYKIKIDRNFQVNKLSKGEYENIDKFFFVDIKHFGGGISFAEKATGHYGRDMRKVLRRIKEELHLC